MIGRDTNVCLEIIRSHIEGIRGRIPSRSAVVERVGSTPPGPFHNLQPLQPAASAPYTNHIQIDYDDSANPQSSPDPSVHNPI